MDISKAHLDACRLRDGEGFEELAAWAGATDVVVYESTGHCHRNFEEARWPAGCRLARVNATRARRFAQAMGE